MRSKGGPFALELKNYSFSYAGGRQVLKDCSLRLEYGQFALLSGRSGEGKSTLLSAISALVPGFTQGSAGGEILIDAKSIKNLSPGKISRRVGHVLQNPDSQIFHGRVADEIAFGCENLNLPPEEIGRRISRACALLELEPDAATATLSGGQKQRLMVACVLAMGQKILLLDEPLANLDLAGGRLLLKTLKGLCAEGYAVLLAEHRLDLVLPYADRVLELENGTIRENNKPPAPFPAPAPLPASDPGEVMLELENVSYGIKNRPIIKNISLKIRRGERIVLLGENGCGKTTLLRLIAGLIKPVSGSVRSAVGPRPGSRGWFRAVGYVYQEPSYQLFMPSVESEVAYGARPESAERCLELFGLQSLRQRHPHSLSEGQKRRLSIAAVSAAEPGLLLLDEPTVGQDDARLQGLISALNRNYERTGSAMITITHDRRCAGSLADRVIWMKAGEIFREGKKELIGQYFSDSFRFEP